MKKILSVLSVVAMSFLFLSTTSCDDATNYTKGYYDGIFTVWGQTIIPEMEDTSYVVGDVSALGLNSGDRAVMKVEYYVDNVYGPKYAKWSVQNVYEKIPSRVITSGDEINKADYQSNILGITGFLNYGAAWAWNGLQNIYVAYESDGSEPDFRMIAPVVKNDTLSLSLIADIKSGDEQYVKLLSYDLTTAYPLLGSDEQNKISRYDSIYTAINLRYYNYDEEAAAEGYIVGGKLKNPFKGDK